jgi:hypothetical protein
MDIQKSGSGILPDIKGHRKVFTQVSHHADRYLGLVQGLHAKNIRFQEGFPGLKIEKLLGRRIQGPKRGGFDFRFHTVPL